MKKTLFSSMLCLLGVVVLVLATCSISLAAPAGLYVAGYPQNTVDHFDFEGNHIRTFSGPTTPGVGGVVIGPDDVLYTNSYDDKGIYRYDPNDTANPASSTGSFTTTNGGNQSIGLGCRNCSDTNNFELLVSYWGDGSVTRYDTSGNTLGALVTGWPSSGPEAIRENNGKVYIAGRNDGTIRVYEGPGPHAYGADESFIINHGAGSNNPPSMSFSNDGSTIYVPVRSGQTVRTYDAATGEQWNDATTSLGGSPLGIATLPSGNLVVGLHNRDTLVQVDITTGAVSDFYTPGDTYHGGAGMWVQTDGGPITPVTDDLVRTWAKDESGDWNVNQNWSGRGGSPDGSDENVTARFADAITQGQLVYSNSDVSVNAVEFDNSNSYAIAGLGTLTLAANSQGTPSITAIQGSHEFQIRVGIQDDTAVNVAAPSAVLQFNNALNLNGNTLTKTGAGTLAINNALSTGTDGTLDCQSGVCTGTGTIGGNLINSSTLAPGDGLGSATVVPEPTAWLLTLLGILWTVTTRWQRQ